MLWNGFHQKTSKFPWYFPFKDTVSCKLHEPYGIMVKFTEKLLSRKNPECYANVSVIMVNVQEKHGLSWIVLFLNPFFFLVTKTTSLQLNSCQALIHSTFELGHLPAGITTNLQYIRYTRRTTIFCKKKIYFNRYNISVLYLSFTSFTYRLVLQIR